MFTVTSTPDAAVLSRKLLLFQRNDLWTENSIPFWIPVFLFTAQIMRTLCVYYLHFYQPKTNLFTLNIWSGKEIYFGAFRRL